METSVVVLEYCGVKGACGYQDVCGLSTLCDDHAFGDCGVINLFLGDHAFGDCGVLNPFLGDHCGASYLGVDGQDVKNGCFRVLTCDAYFQYEVLVFGEGFREVC